MSLFLKNLKVDIVDKQEQFTWRTWVYIVLTVLTFGVFMFLSVKENLPSFFTTLTTALSITLVNSGLSKIDIFNEKMKVSLEYKLFKWLVLILILTIGVATIIFLEATDLAMLNYIIIFTVTPILNMIPTTAQNFKNKEKFNFCGKFLLISLAIVSLVYSIHTEKIQFAPQNYTEQICIILYCVSIQALLGDFLNPREMKLRKQDTPNKKKNLKHALFLVIFSSGVLVATFHMQTWYQKILFNFFAFVAFTAIANYFINKYIAEHVRKMKQYKQSKRRRNTDLQH